MKLPAFDYGVKVLAGISANLEIGFSYDAQPSVVKKSIDDQWWVTAGSTVNILCGFAARGVVSRGILTLGIESGNLPLHLLNEEERVNQHRVLKQNQAVNAFISSDLESWGLDVRILPWRLKSPCSPIKNRRQPNGDRVVHYYPYKGPYLEDRVTEGQHVIVEEIRIARPLVRLASGVRVADMVIVEPFFAINGVPSLRVMNPGTDLLQNEELLRRALALSDFLVMNAQELNLLKTTLDVGNAEGVFAFGPSHLLVTEDVRGATLYGNDHEPVHQPAFQVNAVDATGAGDCFLSHFLTGTLRGDSKEVALRYAAAAAAVQTTMFGGSSVPPESLIEKMLESGKTYAKAEVSPWE